MYGRRLLKVFSLPFSQGSACFPYVFLIAIYVSALVAVYDATGVVLGVPVLWFHEYLFDSAIAFKVYLYTILTTYLFYTFSCAFRVWNDYLSHFGLVLCLVSVAVVVLVV